MSEHMTSVVPESKDLVFTAQYGGYGVVEPAFAETVVKEPASETTASQGSQAPVASPVQLLDSFANQPRHTPEKRPVVREPSSPEVTAAKPPEVGLDLDSPTVPSNPREGQPFQASSSKTWGAPEQGRHDPAVQSAPHQARPWYQQLLKVLAVHVVDLIFCAAMLAVSLMSLPFVMNSILQLDSKGFAPEVWFASWAWENPHAWLMVAVALYLSYFIYFLLFKFISGYTVAQRLTMLLQRSKI